LAVVTTPVGSHLEAVRDAVEALLVEPGDVEQLVSALVRLIDHAEERSRLGRAAREKYVERFNATKYSRDLAALYVHLLGEC
jgi:glycosyltransferase involved in cell wall biosynthesis